MNIEADRNVFDVGQMIEDVIMIEIESELEPPAFQQGQIQLTIVNYKSKILDENNNDARIEFTCEDQNRNRISQIFLIENGICNNLVKFICEVLGYDQFVGDVINLNELVGKKIIATIAHYYDENGVGFANIAFCESYKKYIAQRLYKMAI